MRCLRRSSANHAQPGGGVARPPSAFTSLFSPHRGCTQYACPGITPLPDPAQTGCGEVSAEMLTFAPNSVPVVLKTCRKP
jgi:hypothetical protein